MSKRNLNVSFGTYPFSPFSPKAPAYQRLTFASAIQGQLLFVNPDMSFSAGLLKAVRRKDMGKIYELELQENLVFHNGRKVDAEDLEFSLLRPALLPARPALYEYLTAIKGINDISPGCKFQSGMAPGIRKVNSKLLKFILKISFLRCCGHLRALPFLFFQLKNSVMTTHSGKNTPLGQVLFST